MNVIESVATGVMRGVLNSAIVGTTPAQLINAIENNESLWASGESDIRRHAANIPPFVIDAGNKVVASIEKDYGGFDRLVMDWLKTDQPTYYSIIINTEGGNSWIKRETYDILRKIGFLR